MTDDPDLVISPEAPTDSEGHPVHPDPDKTHRICAATKSEKTTPTEHGRERDDVPYCTLAAGWGVEDTSKGPCKHHSGAIDNRGKNNSQYETGAYVELLKDDLSDAEADAFDEIDESLASDDPALPASVIRELIGDAVLRYRRKGDTRHLKEARSLLKEFDTRGGEGSENPNEQTSDGLDDLADEISKAFDT